MTNSKNPIIVRSNKKAKLQRVITGLVIGGSIVGATAILFSAPIETAETKPEPAKVSWAQKFEPVATPVAEPAPLPTTEVEPMTVEAQRPVVALAHDENDSDFLALARTQLDQGDLRGAYDSLRKHLYSNDPTASVLLDVGRFGRQLGELAVAEQALLDAAAIDPASAPVETELARVLLEAGRLEDARHAAREAIRNDAESPSAWNLAGRVAMAQSEWHRAEASFRRALEIDPTDAMIHNNLGLLYLHMMEGDLAVDALETSVELYGQDAPHFVFNNLGLAHELAQNYEESRGAFEEALVRNPFYARAKVNLRRVETTIATLEEKRSYETARSITPAELADELDEAFELELGEGT